MNQTRKTPKSPVIRPGPGQIWNQNSSSTSNSYSNSKSGSKYGAQMNNNHQAKPKKQRSIFGVIARVLTCRGDIDDVDQDHVHTPPASNLCKF